MWCFYQLFGLSFWRHPFTAEDPLVSKWCNANKLIYIFDGLRMNTWTIPLKIPPLCCVSDQISESCVSGSSKERVCFDCTCSVCQLDTCMHTFHFECHHTTGFVDIKRSEMENWRASIFVFVLPAPKYYLVVPLPVLNTCRVQYAFFLSVQATDWHNKVFQAWDNKWVWYSWSGSWSYAITSVCKCILWFYKQILQIFSSAQHIFTLLHSRREGLLRFHLHPDPLKQRFSNCEVRGRLS